MILASLKLKVVLVTPDTAGIGSNRTVKITLTHQNMTKSLFRKRKDDRAGEDKSLSSQESGMAGITQEYE